MTPKKRQFVEGTSVGAKLTRLSRKVETTEGCETCWSLKKTVLINVLKKYVPLALK